jgi:hypothetical protein
VHIAVAPASQNETAGLLAREPRSNPDGAAIGPG